MILRGNFFINSYLFDAENWFKNNMESGCSRCGIFCGGQVAEKGSTNNTLEKKNAYVSITRP